jgi:hypothetical protein
VRDRIRVLLHSEDAGVRSLLSKHAAELAHAVGAREARVAAGESELGAKPLSVELEGLKAKVSFAKA